MEDSSAYFKTGEENIDLKQPDVHHKSNILSPDKTLNFIHGFYVPSTTTLSIEITKACNLRCPGCWTRFTRDKLDDRSDLTMDDTLIEKTLKFGRFVGIDKVSLIGGEPTLHPDLSCIIQKAIFLGYKGVSVTTNGVFNSSKLKSLVASGLNSISFSIDGSTPAIHENIRPSPGKKSTFDTTINNFREAVIYSREYGFDVIVNHTLFSNNISDTEEVIRLVTGLGAKKIRIHFAFFADVVPGLHNKGKNILMKGNSYISPEAWLAVCRKCKILADQLGNDISIAHCYGTGEVLKAQTRHPPYLQVQLNGNLLMCITHTRLFDTKKKYFGKIVNEKQIELNKESILFNSSIKGTCCKAIPQLISRLPEELQTKVSKAGGLGCIYLPGPLVPSKQS